MRQNQIKELLATGATAVNGWCSLPCPYAAEIIANQGYDSVTVDLQHGAMHFETALKMLQAISTTKAMPMVRVPWNEPGLLMKLLDGGAYGVICPMVNTPREAKCFVSACRYPPLGFRSYGPGRAVFYAKARSGADYARNANDQILLLAQIETQEALSNVDEILATPGLDGLYIGPGDLSLALGAPPSMNPSCEVVTKATALILQKTVDKARICAVHTDGPLTAIKRFRQGFQLCSLQSDVRLLSDGARNQVDAVRKSV